MNFSDIKAQTGVLRGALSPLGALSFVPWPAMAREAPLFPPFPVGPRPSPSPSLFSPLLSLRLSTDSHSLGFLPTHPDFIFLVSLVCLVSWPFLGAALTMIRIHNISYERLSGMECCPALPYSMFILVSTHEVNNTKTANKT